MVKVNLGGCSSFVKDADYKAYVEKALGALEVLENETGKGNDFLGWKHLPSETLNSTLVADCEAVRDSWKAKNVDLVVVIGIGGSYLGAKCALEALSHQFAKQLKNKGEAPEIVFAGQNLSEEYMCELMDLVQERNAWLSPSQVLQQNRLSLSVLSRSILRIHMARLKQLSAS